MIEIKMSAVSATSSEAEFSSRLIPVVGRFHLLQRRTEVSAFLLAVNWG